MVARTRAGRRRALATVRVPTELEEIILRRIGLRDDPWGVYTGNSRIVSQAISRCIRKGWVTRGRGRGVGDAYQLTQAGRDLPCVKNCMPSELSHSSREGEKA